MEDAERQSHDYRLHRTSEPRTRGGRGEISHCPGAAQELPLGPKRPAFQHTGDSSEVQLSRAKSVYSGVAPLEVQYVLDRAPGAGLPDFFTRQKERAKGWRGVSKGGMKRQF